MAGHQIPKYFDQMNKKQRQHNTVNTIGGRRGEEGHAVPFA